MYNNVGRKKPPLTNKKQKAKFCFQKASYIGWFFLIFKDDNGFLIIYQTPYIMSAAVYSLFWEVESLYRDNVGVRRDLAVFSQVYLSSLFWKRSQSSEIIKSLGDHRMGPWRTGANSSPAVCQDGLSQCSHLCVPTWVLLWDRPLSKVMK